MQGNQRSFMASENIGSSLFVNLKKVSGVNQAQLEVSHADEQAYGVSHQGSREAPIPGVTPIAAAAGESCVVYGIGDPCEVLCGEASNAGDYLKPNADGKAIVCSEGDLYSAQAVSTTSAANQAVKVTVMRGVTPGVKVDAVAALGSIQGDAALLAVGFNTVSAADATKGVVLPASVPGRVVRVYNEHATGGLKIYPPVSSAINGGSVNAAITTEGRTLAYLECVTTTNWAAVFTVNA